ncbi:hypothetical protein [Bacillus thuringiensis]|nr:hypothetical protein [Bacillus thuringiensis]
MRNSCSSAGQSLYCIPIVGRGFIVLSEITELILEIEKRLSKSY